MVHFIPDLKVGVFVTLRAPKCNKFRREQIMRILDKLYDIETTSLTERSFLRQFNLFKEIYGMNLERYWRSIPNY